MKIKLQTINSSATYTIKNDAEAYEHIISLIDNPDIISVSIIKQMPKVLNVYGNKSLKK